VRSLAHDLGARLGCGAYLAALTRTAVGPLHLEAALGLSTLEDSAPDWLRWLLPLDLPLREWAPITLDPPQVIALQHGQPLQPVRAAAGRYRAVDQAGQLVAWGVVDGTGRFTPSGVLPA
jgi:tRNA pseudouridine55 synthase